MKDFLCSDQAGNIIGEDRLHLLTGDFSDSPGYSVITGLRSNTGSVQRASAVDYDQEEWGLRKRTVYRDETGAVIEICVEERSDPRHPFQQSDAEFFINVKKPLYCGQIPVESRSGLDLSALVYTECKLGSAERLVKLSPTLVKAAEGLTPEAFVCEWLYLDHLGTLMTGVTIEEKVCVTTPSPEFPSTSFARQRNSEIRAEMFRGGVEKVEKAQIFLPIPPNINPRHLTRETLPFGDRNMVFRAVTL